jgi:hypothetical protein
LRIASPVRPRFIEFEFCVCISAEKAEYTRQLSGTALDALPGLFGVTKSWMFGSPEEKDDTSSCPDTVPNCSQGSTLQDEQIHHGSGEQRRS